MKHLHLIFWIAFLAVSVLLPAPARSDMDERMLFLQANDAYDRKDYEKARLLYIQIRTVAPNSQASLGGEANCLLMTGKKAEALAIYRKLLVLRPGDADLVRQVEKMEEHQFSIQSPKPSVPDHDWGFLGLGLGWPYASAKYRLNPAVSTEGRFSAWDGVSVASGRLYWNFMTMDQLFSVFTGAEYGYVQFDTLDLRGTGSEAAWFIGGEYLISNRFCFHMDIAPTLITLNSDQASVDGMEWVSNLALYYYIF